MPTRYTASPWHKGQLIEPTLSVALQPHGAGRFAPSTSGPPHPGTLASALLVWLDARQRGARALLRLEDLDPQRAKPAFADAICRGLCHMGLVFDSISYQSHAHRAHAAALDALACQGLLYACDCTRDAIASRRAHSTLPTEMLGGYDNACRASGPLSCDGWRTAPGAVRVQLPQGDVCPVDVGGLNLRQAPADAFGDPIVRRRDKSVAYILASVVDDAHADVGHVVRGCDLATLTATQVALMQLLDLRVPTFRHHPVLLDKSGRKWSKSRPHASPADIPLLSLPGHVIVGRLAYAWGLIPNAMPIAPHALLEHFTWQRVIAQDVYVPAL